MIKNEEWDLVLNTPTHIEVTPPSLDSIIKDRAKKSEEESKEQ